MKNVVHLLKKHCNEIKKHFNVLKKEGKENFFLCSQMNNNIHYKNYHINMEQYVCALYDLYGYEE